MANDNFKPRSLSPSSHTIWSSHKHSQHNTLYQDHRLCVWLCVCRARTSAQRTQCWVWCSLFFSRSVSLFPVLLSFCPSHSFSLPLLPVLPLFVVFVCVCSRWLLMMKWDLKKKKRVDIPQGRDATSTKSCRAWMQAVRSDSAPVSLWKELIWVQSSLCSLSHRAHSNTVNISTQ